MSYLIFSPKHTRRGDPYVTFWRSEQRGYAWPLRWAGRYKECEALDIASDDALPVPEHIVGSMAIDRPDPGWIDGDVGPVVPNTRANRKRLIAASVAAGFVA